MSTFSCYSSALNASAVTWALEDVFRRCWRSIRTIFLNQSRELQGTHPRRIATTALVHEIILEV